MTLTQKQIRAYSVVIWKQRLKKSRDKAALLLSRRWESTRNKESQASVARHSTLPRPSADLTTTFQRPDEPMTQCAFLPFGRTADSNGECIYQQVVQVQRPQERGQHIHTYIYTFTLAILHRRKAAVVEVLLAYLRWQTKRLPQLQHTAVAYKKHCCMFFFACWVLTFIRAYCVLFPATMVQDWVTHKHHYYFVVVVIISDITVVLFLIIIRWSSFTIITFGIAEDYCYAPHYTWFYGGD